MNSFNQFLLREWRQSDSLRLLDKFWVHESSALRPALPVVTVCAGAGRLARDKAAAAALKLRVQRHLLPPVEEREITVGGQVAGSQWETTELSRGNMNSLQL